MIFKKEFEKYGFDTIVAYSGTDITDTMIEECFKLDREFYNQEYSIENSQIKNIIKNFGQICFVLIEQTEQKVIGYSYWIPIKPKVFLDFLDSGKILLNLELAQCSNFNEKSVSLFSAGEAFLAGYDLNNLHKAVEDLFLHKILVLAKKGIKVDYVAMEAVCDYDKIYLAPKLGMEKGATKENSVFYCVPYSPKIVYPESSVSKELLNFYS